MIEMTNNNDHWIQRYHPAPDAEARLACFPYAGGSASFYFPTSQALSPSVEVLAIQYPGRQDRHAEPALTNIEALADGIADALNKWTDRPLAFFGHSMGSLVAYEVARRLQRDGVTLSALFASGGRAPHLWRSRGMHKRPDSALIDELRELGGTESSALDNEEVLQMVLPTLRHDYQAIETYRYDPSPRLTCPILALIGDRDPRVSVNDVRGWDEHTSAGLDVRVLPGGHFYLVNQQTAILDIIGEHIQFPTGVE
ncbi:alpha/beta fold hydrolase [Streptomyces lacrimifluminis]|uniref:Oleoyl-ACP hydrolase n=1 Tax=Streptomyces lacrimifluminis TaxID=1500077 RepID=A0A917UNP3_9ACTN|nr:thioesterase II family protein [Streptomyces lacrimifluminis]GGJ71259.1 oleoyl-ACP hydrolase [Streptomyces lacrimifluminis]